MWGLTFEMEKLLLRDEYLTLQVFWCVVSFDNQTCMHENGYAWVLW